MILRKALLVATALAISATANADSPPRIAIIIDDLGYRLDAGRRAIALPGPLSFAVLPGTPQGRELARVAHESGKEVLLHLPLEAVAHDGPPEPGGLTLDMTRSQFREAFSAYTYPIRSFQLRQVVYCIPACTAN